MDIARTSQSFTLAANVPQQHSVLAAWMTDVGLASGGHLPGLTVGPLMYRLDVNAAAAVVSTITWGFIVVPEMVTTTADITPVGFESLDWMEWGKGTFGVPVTPNILQIVGNGDEGFRRTRTKRVLKQVEDDLKFVINSANSVTVDLHCSTVITLP